jgi:hypothetical protein
MGVVAEVKNAAATVAGDDEKEGHHNGDDTNSKTSGVVVVKKTTLLPGKNNIFVVFYVSAGEIYYGDLLKRFCSHNSYHGSVVCERAPRNDDAVCSATTSSTHEVAEYSSLPTSSRP